MRIANRQTAKRPAATTRLLAAAILAAATLAPGALPAFAQGRAAPAERASAWRDDALASDAIRLLETLRKDSGDLSRNAPGSLAEEAGRAAGRGDYDRAMKLQGAAIVAAPDDSALWLAYARLAGGAEKPNVWNGRLREQAGAAAYGGWLRAGSAEARADALAELARVFVRRDMFRPALNAYKAALAQREDPGLREAWRRLREAHGFRVVKYDVDSDAASPRVCFHFSEPLEARVDYSPYVTQAGEARAALSVEEAQLCVEGLAHSQRYSIALRQGLPSSIADEPLEKTANYEIYVADRKPQARFAGRNYVLPRAGQEGLPVVTVNTPRVAIELYRIGERGLAPLLRGEEFLKQISGEGARRIAEEQGAKIWSGTLETGGEINKDATTAFPVLEAAPKLAAGVYVMTAEPDGAPKAEEDWSQKATQWFIVSDIGLTAFTGPEGASVVARSLASAEPKGGLRLKLVARNNEVLGLAQTDKRGFARFDPGLTRGEGGQAPGVLVAEDGAGDFGFLDMAGAPFDLSDRGVLGRIAPKGLDALVYPERGVYRPGETVAISALLREARGAAAPGLPLTFVARRPDGVEYKRQSVPDQGLGGRVLPLYLAGDAPTGAWRVQVFADPKGAAIGEATFLVEDYVPERLDVRIEPEQKILRPGESAALGVAADYLYGAPGADLNVSGDISLAPAPGDFLPGYPGYVAGLTDETFETMTGEIEAGAKTDAKGRARIEAAPPKSDAMRPLEARFLLRVGEAGGRAVERVVKIPVAMPGVALGLKKNFGADLAAGQNATFEVVAVAPSGARVAQRAVRWTLSRIERQYQWYQADGRWSYEPIKRVRRAAEGTLDVEAGAPAKIEAPVEWGQYRLDLRAADGQSATSVTFDIGWGGQASADTPDLLPVSLDARSFRAGDKAGLTIEAQAAGEGFVAILADGLRELLPISLKAGRNRVEIPVKAEWGAGAYALASAHRPLDAKARRMPGRALGLAWFAIDSEQRALAVKIEAPAKARPREALELPIQLAGLAPGEEAYATVALVDVGILNLTRYEAPKPDAYFFGQKQISDEMRDLYGLLIDGMQGARGRIRSGGDAGAGAPEGDRPTQAPLAFFSGVVKADAQGRLVARFDIPAFNGTARAIAVAWTKGRAGSAQADVILRDPVVVQGTVPRFLALGDRSRLFLDIHNVEGAAGDYKLEIEPSGPIVLPAEALSRRVSLKKGERIALAVPTQAAGVGAARLAVSLTGPGIDARQTFETPARAGVSDLYRRSTQQLAAGARFSLSGDLIGDFLPKTGSVAVTLSPFGAIDAAGLLQALDRYPYGCTEQTVSRALPLLYVNQLAATQNLASDGEVDKRVREAVDRVFARQDSNGDFGLWSAGGAQDMWLNAYVVDFLTRAKERGFATPQKNFDMALDRLRNYVANAPNEGAADGALAYSLYVLARNGRPVMGDLRYIADARLDQFKDGLSRAQIGAALALLGDRTRARTAFAQSLDALGQSEGARVWRADYGSRLRDGAGALALIAESGEGGPAALQRANNVIEQANAATRATSTQEQAWLVLAAQALAKASGDMRVEIDGKAHEGAFSKVYREADFAAGPVAIVNRGETALRVVVTTSGAPIAPEPADQQGYDIERAFYRLDGRKVEGAVAQNERLVVVLKIVEREARAARLLVVDRLPAGLEIDNPRLVESGAVSGLSWLKREVEPEHVEYRDDRFVAAFNRSGSEKAVFSLAYIARAVTPGRYTLPPASVEDMYRPERFGRTAFGAFEVTAP